MHFHFKQFALKNVKRSSNIMVVSPPAAAPNKIARSATSLPEANGYR
jgi:hypothetical protein